MSQSLMNVFNILSLFHPLPLGGSRDKVVMYHLLYIWIQIKEKKSNQASSNQKEVDCII